MKLSEFSKNILERAEAVSPDAADVAQATDPLITPFKKLAAQKEQIKSLKKATMGMVWIGPNGPTAYDSEAFAGIQSQILDLEAKIAHNQEVLTRLELVATESYSLQSLSDRKAKLQEKIRFIKKAPDHDLRHLFDAAATMGDRSAAEEHPAVQEARADSARKIVPLQQEFDKLGSQLERLQEILGDFRP